MADSDTLIGQTVSHYHILENVGSGGMGVVYKAEDLKLGRFVALKFLPEDLSHDSKSLERFWREARAASALNHPNICTIYEVGEHEGQHFIAMELLEGETLAARIERGAVPLAEAMRIALGLLAALQVLHPNELVHLSCGDPTVTQTQITTPGLLVGTLSYMSPEQLLGHAITPASDLFAAG